MYDKMNEAREFFADSRDEALADAARFFGAEEDELRISDLDSSSVYGLGARMVLVAARKSAPRVTSGGDDGDRGRGDRGGRRDRGGRDRGRGRGREGGDRGRGRDDGERGRRPHQLEVAADSKGTVRGTMGEIGDFVLGAIERMGLGPFEIEQSADGDYLIFQIDGDAANELGAGDGRGVDALQLLANQASMQLGDDEPRVIVDAAGGSEKRESFLSRLADRAAKRSVETKRSVALDPMNPKDRRIIHVALRDVDDVATMSTGSGRYRQVVVVPEGSPEYDEARRVSEAANARD